VLAFLWAAFAVLSAAAMVAIVFTGRGLVGWQRVTQDFCL
jgi:hypothetical protein